MTLPVRAFQWDLARQVERLDWLLKQLPRYAEWGYQELYLHLEDAVDYPSLPGVARPDAYRYRDLARLVERAGQAGLKVVPIANLLGHTQYLIKTPEWRDLNELRAADGSPLERGQICPLHPRTLEVADRLLRDLAPFCTAGKVHVGLDESFQLGRHPLSRAEIAEVGLAGHFARHAQRLQALARGRGLGLGLWGDMLALLPAAISQLPAGVTVYDWYYYPFERLPRLELHNFAEYDLAAPLRARGLEYWGCPMNGAFRFEPMPVFGDRLANLRSWWRRCAETGAAGFLVSSWEPSRLAIELTSAVDAAAACLWLDPEIEDSAGMLAKGFERALGASRTGGRALAREALAADERAFAGYARWEINDRWDVAPLREGTARPASELAFFTRLQRRTAVFSPAWTASVDFRRYLAARDVFVRRAAGAVAALRRRQTRAGSASAAGVTAGRRLRREWTALEALVKAFAGEIAAGRRAARAMWARTRDRRMAGPNETMVAADGLRLRAFRRWLREAARRPDRLYGPSAVGGAWQLQFAVINFAPALQKISVEMAAAAPDENGAQRDRPAEANPGQRGTPGEDAAGEESWIALHSRFTIEFRAAAARPGTRIRREFSAPVPSPAVPLRITIRGLGPVSIASIELTDGARVLRPRGWTGARRETIGNLAPAEGFPEIDWSRVEGEIRLSFDPPKS